jgi:hypothetical protein
MNGRCKKDNTPESEMVPRASREPGPKRAPVAAYRGPAEVSAAGRVVSASLAVWRHIRRTECLMRIIYIMLNHAYSHRDLVTTMPQ